MEFRGDYGKGISVKLIWSANNGVLSYIKVIFNGIAPLLKSTAVMFGLAGYKSLLLAIMARMMGKKLFLRTSLIGYDDAHSITGQFKYKTGKLFISLMDTVICNSRLIEQSFRDMGYGAKTAYIPNGVDSCYYKPVDKNTLTDVRRSYNIPQNACVLVYSGSISERKNIHFLINALFELKKLGGAFVLFLVGPLNTEKYPTFDKRYWQFIQGLISRSKLIDDVFFYSYDDQDAAIYQLADIYVSASLAEGMPNAMLEAMSCGLPVVALDLDGNLDGIIRDGENGFSVRTEDPAYFANRVNLIATDPALKKMLAMRSREIIKSDYTIEQTANGYLDLFCNESRS